MNKLFFIGLIFWTTSSLAQFNYAGQLIDQETKIGIPFASLYCSELNTIVLSDSSGNFEFNFPRKGKYNLIISHLSYQPKNQKINKDSITNVRMIISMEARKYSLEPIVISSSFPTASNENSYNIETVLISDMESKAGFTIMDALLQIPGVSGVSSGPLVNRPQIRGLSSNRILRVVDGIRLESQQWDDEHGLGINELGVDRIELIKGPSGLLFGPEAMGGVLHFIEEKPAPIGHKEGSILAKAYSNNLGFHSKFKLKESKDNYHWGVFTLGRINSDYFYDLYDFRVPNTRLAEYGAKGFIGTSKSWGSTRISYLYSEAYYGILDGKDIIKKPDGSIVNIDSLEKEKFPFEIEAPYHRVINHRINSTTNLLFDKSKLELILGYQNNHRIENEEKTGLKKGYEYLNMNLQSVSYNLKWFFMSNKDFESIIGSQGMYEINTNKPGAATQLIPDASIQDLAFFTLNKLSYKKYLFSGGIRYDFRKIVNHANDKTESVFKSFEKNYSNISYALGINIKWSENLLSRINFASAYRSPNLNELNANGFKLESQRFEIGNPNFKKEFNKELDLGFTLRQTNYDLQLDLFYNNVSDYIYLQPSGKFVQNNLDSTSLVPEFNFKQEDAVIYGGEFQVHIHPKEWKRISYTFTASTLTAFLSKSNNYLYQMPSNQLRNSIDYLIANTKTIQNLKFSIGSQSVLKQYKVAPNEAKTPAYNLYNAGIKAKINRIEYSLTANNLFDKKYLDHLSRFRSYEIYSPGLNICISVKMELF